LCCISIKWSKENVSNKRDLLLWSKNELSDFKEGIFCVAVVDFRWKSADNYTFTFRERK
jgi:hypothetical protein